MQVGAVLIILYITTVLFLTDLLNGPKQCTSAEKRIAITWKASKEMIDRKFP